MNPTVQLGSWAFRTAIRAGVVDGYAGLRRWRSDSLVSVQHCLVAHPLLAELLTGPRYLGAREVVLRCGATTGERLAATTPADSDADLPADVSRDHIHEVVAGSTWRISARSFFQSRVDGAEALVKLVGEAADGLGDSSRALDLYSGVGIYAGALSRPRLGGHRGRRIQLVCRRRGGEPIRARCRGRPRRRDQMAAHGGRAGDRRPEPQRPRGGRRGHRLRQRCTTGGAGQLRLPRALAATSESWPAGATA